MTSVAQCWAYQTFVFIGEVQEMHTQNNQIALHKISLSQGESRSLTWKEFRSLLQWSSISEG